MTFEDDLAFGQQTEKEVQSLIGGTLSGGRFSPYDLKIEIKQDRKFNETDNVAIEVSCKGKASGVSTTESEYYLYKLDKIYYCNTERLKRFIREYVRNYPSSIVSGGDGNRARMVLIPLTSFYLMFKELFK